MYFTCLVRFDTLVYQQNEQDHLLKDRTGAILDQAAATTYAMGTSSLYVKRAVLAEPSTAYLDETRL